MVIVAITFHGVHLNYFRCRWRAIITTITTKEMLVTMVRLRKFGIQFLEQILTISSKRANSSEVI